jgi:polyisoprenoid-binding protein YceI
VRDIAPQDGEVCGRSRIGRAPGVPKQCVMTRLDRTQSTIGFDIRHMGVATVHGEFTSFSGGIEPDGARLMVDVTSVETGDPIRDRRLRTEFFAADQFPAIEFHTDGIAGTIHGELTIRGVTRPITLKAHSEPLDDRRVRLHAEGRIRRSDFGLDWDALRKAGRLIVADHVRLHAVVVLER